MNISLAFVGDRIVLFIFFSILFFSFIVSYAQYLARIIERDNSAVGRNRFTGHPRCGEFDNWVSNNWLLSSARKTLAHCHRIWNRKMLVWWFYAMLIFQLTSVFKKTYSSGPNDFSTLKCFLHFFVGFFSLCCLQRYLKHYMHKFSLEFHMLVWNFIYSHKRIFCRGVYSRISWV